MQRNIWNCCFNYGKHRMLSSNVLSKRFPHRSISSKARDVNEVKDEPVKYSASAAGNFKARASLMDDDGRLWYEPPVVIASLSIFLIYFLILREENDLDEEILMPLHERIAGLEEIQLKTVINNSTNPEEVSAAKLRLEEIRIDKEDRDV